MLSHIRHGLKDRFKSSQGANSSSNSTTLPPPISSSLLKAPPLENAQTVLHIGAFDPRKEGLTQAQRTFVYFYSRKHAQFCAKVESAEALDKQHGYVVWPVAIAMWTLADTYARTKSKDDLRRLEVGFAALERHWNEKHSAYTAWVQYDGNDDVYYDDNAHCANALISAHEATGDPRFLDRAVAIMTKLVPTGWDRTGHPGGVPWHIGKNNSRNACSTCALAVAAGRLALMGVQKEYFSEMLADLVGFTEAHLIGYDEMLVNDSIGRSGDSDWKVERVKWTYNTGFAIHACVLLHQLRGGSERHLELANKMAQAAIDHRGPLYDKKSADPVRRWWRDSTFFAQHLVEGLAVLAKAQPDTDIARQIMHELEHFAAFVRIYLQDPNDGMYWRSLRLYVIDDARTAAYNALTGGERWLEPDSSERENGKGAAEHRPIAKTMLANAAVARIFMLTGELVKTVHVSAIEE
ncbi:glycosyl hydrolase family 76-domain-containing protein [Limtongia smithiae]|uniref:glycosyl hydrolase family 76-domain-containing protein n=1 Tax=Limtongia smithiae TaxID=1125753 RepID=UPI0034CEE14B